MNIKWRVAIQQQINISPNTYLRARVAYIVAHSLDTRIHIALGAVM